MARKKSGIDWRCCGRCGSRYTKISGMIACPKCGPIQFQGMDHYTTHDIFGRRSVPSEEPQRYKFRSPRSKDELDFK